jgi:hypothetical protein
LRAGDDGLEFRGKSLEIEMTMTIDEHARSLARMGIDGKRAGPQRRAD